jgi:peptidoglycan/LPS O-acetylase OafA/YrhL
MSEMTPVEASPTTSTPVPPALGETAAEAHRRVDLYDGLRGIAIVLVVLSHGWYLWPIDWIDRHAWVRPFFRSGNSGVTIFLVAAGFLMFRSLTARRPLFAMRADTTFVRRVARVGPSLWLFLVVAVVVAAMDSSTEAWHADTGASVFHVATYTWNWYLQTNTLVSRPDFGHLWYLSVDMQAFLIMACLCYLLRRHRIGLLFATAGFYLLLVWWRFHVAPVELMFQVLLRTTVRMDPFVVGVLTAAALPYLVRLRLSPRAVSLAASASLLLVVPLLYWCDDDLSYLRWGGTMLEWDVALFFVAVALGGTSALVTAVTGTRLATWLGRNSLLLYIWHFPVFVFVARHTIGSGWSWEARTLVALTATVVICVLADRLLERRVKEWIRRPAWRDLDDGLPHWLRLKWESWSADASARLHSRTSTRHHRAP